MKDYHNHKDQVCPHCGKDFDKERKLKNHISDTHKEQLKDLPGTKLKESIEALNES